MDMHGHRQSAQISGSRKTKMSPPEPWAHVRACALAAVAVTIWLGCAACKKAPHTAESSVKGPSDHFVTVTLVPPTGKSVRVRAELAVREQERSTGLMFRGQVDEGTGMLFVFPTQEPLVFWMKNTLVPLDMIFVRSDKTVAGVVHNAAPQTTNGRRVDEPTQYVLEVPGGYCKKHGIVRGTRLEFTLPDWVLSEIKRQAKERSGGKS